MPYGAGLLSHSIPPWPALRSAPVQYPAGRLQHRTGAEPYSPNEFDEAFQEVRFRSAATIGAPRVRHSR